MASLTDLGTVLALWAHPDDETYLTGGLLGALRDVDQRAVCVTATRGEAAEPDAGPQERTALAELRTRELEAALGLLGVTEHHWWDYPDGGCGDLDPAQPVTRLVALLDDVRPDTLVTFGPDGFTGHPDHRTVSAWADQAVLHAAEPPRLLHAVSQEPAVDAELDEEYGVFDLGRPRLCTDAELAFQLRLDGPALERKVDALLRQVSQTGGLVAAVGRERFSAWVATESFADPPQTR